MKFIALFFLTLLSLEAFNIEVSSMLSNGKTLLVEVTKEKGLSFVGIEILKKKYKFIQNPRDKTRLYALVPMSYYQEPSIQQLQLEYIQEQRTHKEIIPLQIKDAEYAKESIQVDDSKVNPKSKETLERISLEYKKAMSIYGTTTPKSYINSKFIMPLESVITSDFGKARVYNNTLKGYHGGTDFRAKVGTPIVASNDGVVALVDDRFYSGGTVIIDHGEGVYSCYFHMSGFKVHTSQRVKRGEVIGLSGDSGRVSGPHLHFAFRVAGLQVDPLQFIDLMNTKIFKDI